MMTFEVKRGTFKSFRCHDNKRFLQLLQHLRTVKFRTRCPFSMIISYFKDQDFFRNQRIPNQTKETSLNKNRSFLKQ